MEKEPLVTVGIPTFNRPHGLLNTLNLVTNQTYKNLEIIISDNCSEDSEAVKKVIHQFSNDQRIQFFRQSENLGSLGNFRFLASQASGSYFLWVSDDDKIELNYIEKLVTEILKDQEISVVLAGYDVEDTMSKPIIRLNLTSHHKELEKPTAYERMYTYVHQKDHLGKSRLNWGIFPTKLIRRAFSECSSHLTPGTQAIWADFPIDFRLLSYGKLKVIEEILWHVKLLPNSDGKANLTGSFKKLLNISRRTEASLISVVSNSTLNFQEKQILTDSIQKKALLEKLQLFGYYKIIGCSPWLARRVKVLWYKLFS